MRYLILGTLILIVILAIGEAASAASLEALRGALHV